MKPPFSLVPDDLSNNTEEALQQLIEMARRRELIGFAFVGMLRQRKYFANAAGEAYRNPTWTRGCLRDLDDKLGRRVRGEPNGL